MHKLLPSCPLLSNLHGLSKGYNPSIAILFFVDAEVSLYCFHCSRVLIIRTADVRYTRDDEHLLVWNHIDIMLAMHQMYMMVTSNKFDPFHEVMNPNVLGSNNCDDCVRWHLCGQTCHYSKMITMRWEYDHQPKWQKYVILKNKTGTLNESPSKMKVQLYKSKIKVHIYSMPFEDGSCALRRRDVRTALMFKKINNNGCSTETDLRVDDILLLYSAALNNSNDLQSHRAFIMINHQTSTSWWSQSPHDRLIEQWYVGQIQRHPMLNCSHGYTNNYSIMIYMEIRFQVSHVFPLQPNLQYIFPTCYKTKEKQPTPCGREDSYSHEQHLQLFKEARSFVELNSIYCSLLTQFRLEQSEYCKGHNFMAIQHHYEAQEVLTDTQIHTCNLMLATCINGTLLMDMKWNTRFYTPYHYKILFYSAKYTNEHSLSQNNQN